MAKAGVLCLGTRKSLEFQQLEGRLGGETLRAEAREGINPDQEASARLFQGFPLVLRTEGTLPGV